MVEARQCDLLSADQTTGSIILLQDQHTPAGTCQVSCGHQCIVATAHENCIIGFHRRLLLTVLFVLNRKRVRLILLPSTPRTLLNERASPSRSQYSQGPAESVGRDLA